MISLKGCVMERAKGDRPMELAQKLEKTSPLAAARLHRQLTVEEAAKRAGLTADEVEWLEDGRVYRFPSADAALVATGDTRLTDPATGAPYPTARPLFVRQTAGPALSGTATCS